MWPYNPYWWLPQTFGAPFAQQFGGRCNNRRQYGLMPPTLNTTGALLSDASVDFGIDPCAYNCLPCESLVLLRINSAVPTGGEALPVTIVVPSFGRSTLDASTATSAGTAMGTTKVPVVDSQDNPVVGDDIEVSTERLAYINKCTGTIRFVEFTSGAAAAAAETAGE